MIGDTGGSRHVYFSAEAMNIIKEMDRGELSKICNEVVKECRGNSENLEVIEKELKLVEAEKEIINNKLKILKEEKNNIDSKYKSINQKYQLLRKDKEWEETAPERKAKEKRELDASMLKTQKEIDEQMKQVNEFALKHKKSEEWGDAINFEYAGIKNYAKSGYVEDQTLKEVLEKFKDKTIEEIKEAGHKRGEIYKKRKMEEYSHK